MTSFLNSLVSRLKKHEPRVRQQHVLDEIEGTFDDDEGLLEEIGIAISSTKEKILQSEGSERFLDVRVKKYRALLANLTVKIDAQNISRTDRLRKVELTEGYHLKICDIIDIQKKILAEIETLKRKLNDLERKKEDLMLKKDECEGYLMTNAFNSGHIGNMTELEMGVLHENRNDSRPPLSLHEIS
eukprot:28300_1